ncbi:MAG: extracellular solute-binding protein [Acidimicrobiales bacterium]
MKFRSRFAVVALSVVVLATACGPGKKSASSPSKSNGGVTESTLPNCPVDAFKKSSTPTEVVLWTSYVGNTIAALTKIVDAYNASQTKVHIRLESQGVNYEELRKNYDAGLAAGQLPALVAGEDTWTQYMIDNTKTLPAQSCINADKDPRAKIDDLLPGIKAAYSVGGVQWPAAFGASTVVLYYNRNHFKAAGLDPDKPPTNLTELRAAAEALKKVPAPDGPAGEPLAMKLDPWFVENMLAAENQTIVNHDNGRDGNRATESTIESKSADTALNWLASMKQDGLLNAISSQSLIDHYVAVATQKSSMLLETSTAATIIDQVTSSAGGLKLSDVVDAETAKKFAAFDGLTVPFKVGVAQVPGITVSGKGQAGGSAFYMTNTGSKEVQSAAWDFMKYFNQTDNQVIWTSQGSYLPVRASAQKALNDDPAWGASQRGQWITTAYDSMKGLSADFPGPLIGPYDKFRDIERAMLETIALGDASTAEANVKPALATATSAINDALTKYNQTNK